MAANASGDGTVGKALDVLDQVAAFGRPVRFAELQAESPFPKATLYRFVQTLTNQGMLSFDRERNTYALGVRLVRLAHAAWEQSSLAPIARDEISRLADDVGETVHLAQMDHAQVLYVDKRDPERPVAMFSQAGKVGPAYCTGVGKAMMAWLDEESLCRIVPQQSFHRFTPKTLTNEIALRKELANIRDRGFAYDDEEHEPGIICVALPILSPRGRVLGALSVTTSTARKSLSELETLVPRIRLCAQSIGTEAEAWRFPDQISKEVRTA
ncbi:MAG: IclR family transcriptional regulator [Rhodobacteraceae bacterium]|nr:IclR family transcriptional regulator [Paracoccaceae bacterium]